MSAQTIKTIYLTTVHCALLAALVISYGYMTGTLQGALFGGGEMQMAQNQQEERWWSVLD